MGRKLFLTSTGLSNDNNIKHFIKLLNKKPKETKVCFIPNAADPYDDKWFIETDKNQLNNVGFKIFEVDLKKENQKSLLEKLFNCDFINMSGGNTFYLLYWVRKSGLDKILPDLLDQGKIYLGESASSVLAGPNIELSGWDKDWDTNDVNLKDLTGLNLVPFVVSPHFEETHKSILEEKSKKVGYPIYALNDKQAVVCIDDKYEIVGEGEKIIYNNE